MLGFPMLYLKGMRILMFQLSGFYCKLLLSTSPQPLLSLAQTPRDPWPPDIPSLGLGFWSHGSVLGGAESGYAISKKTDATGFQLDLSGLGLMV